MKIGIVLATSPGYSETFFTSKIKGLQKNGMEVLLFVREKNKNFTLCKQISAPKVYTNPVKQFISSLLVFTSLLPHFKKVFRFIKLEKKRNISFVQIYKKVYLNAHILKHKLDWLHFGFATQALGSELVAKAIGAKMAVSFRGFDINVYPLKHPNCYKAVWENVDKVHSISNYLLTKAWQIGLSKSLPYQIITPAVDINKIKKSSISNQQSITLVTIARLNWIKGLNIAIQAMKFLKDKKINFKYYIIGSGTDKETERYKYQAYALGLEKEVIFTGKRSHKETLQLLNIADLYVQPSFNEGFCNALLEAQTLGKLCIASNTGGLPENIENGKTGWLIPKYNPQALANKIIEIVHLPEDKKQVISTNAQKRVKKYFTIEQQEKKFVEFYNN